ncbi:hypothetical protein, partial [Anaerotignum sp.]|uniref:hypothetical protein n=1 Tax=Anaerotignum sp. TaxID=2039241 RepID=UPI003A9448C7
TPLHLKLHIFLHRGLFVLSAQSGAVHLENVFFFCLSSYYIEEKRQSQQLPLRKHCFCCFDFLRVAATAIFIRKQT